MRVPLGSPSGFHRLPGPAAVENNEAALCSAGKHAFIAQGHLSWLEEGWQGENVRAMASSSFYK